VPRSRSSAAGRGLQPTELRDEALVARVWRHHAYPATLVPDLLDVLVEEEAWLASQAGRAPRSRAELARLIDGSVLEEALAGR
jgi:NitT/TauT family transport system substrate-binding protein